MTVFFAFLSHFCIHWDNQVIQKTIIQNYAITFMTRKSWNLLYYYAAAWSRYFVTYLYVFESRASRITKTIKLMIWSRYWIWLFLFLNYIKFSQKKNFSKWSSNLYLNKTCKIQQKISLLTTLLTIIVKNFWHILNFVRVE